MVPFLLAGGDPTWIEGAYLLREPPPEPSPAVAPRAKPAGRSVFAGHVYGRLRAEQYDRDRREWRCLDLDTGAEVYRTARELGR